MINNINKLQVKCLLPVMVAGGFYADAIERTWPGSVIMDKRIKHGLRNTSEYHRWLGIKNKCYNNKSKHYKWYGIRCIKMWDGWINNPKSFIEYIKSLPNYGEIGMSLDRIDNDGDYEPNNLRWTSWHIQSTNRGLCKSNRTGYKGVYILPNGYGANIRVNKVRVHLGSHSTIKSALKARNQYIIDNDLTEYQLQ